MQRDNKKGKGTAFLATEHIHVCICT